MGKWMEVVNVYYKKLDVQWKPAWESWEDSLSPRVVGETWPQGLMWAADALGPRARSQFPMLFYVWRGSKAYEDESLWLRPEETLILLDEFQRMRRLCRREEFIWHIDAEELYEAWRDGWPPKEQFEKGLDIEEQLLERSIAEDYWVHLMI